MDLKSMPVGFAGTMKHPTNGETYAIARHGGFLERAAGPLAEWDDPWTLLRVTDATDRERTIYLANMLASAWDEWHMQNGPFEEE